MFLVQGSGVMSSDRGFIHCPPPPPPLPSLFSSNQYSSREENYGPCSCKRNPEQELIEARNRLWEFEGTIEPPNVSYYRYIEPILQDGPTCGLVALSMVSSCTSRPLSVDQLFEEAKTRGFTNHGEMFSVDNMATLAREMFCHRCKEVEVLSGGLGQDKDYIIHHLSVGSVLLVPYDADANHSPCCRRGHKAHWAVVSGVMLSSSPRRSCHVLARQGKSRHLAVWSYDDLQDSNNNLMELDPGRARDGRNYVLPPGGVAAGLGGRAILLHGLGSEQFRSGL